MEPKDIAIGDEFIRQNGTVVRVTNERIVRGLREVQLTPISGKGRTSWKWDQGVLYDLMPKSSNRRTTIE